MLKKTIFFTVLLCCFVLTSCNPKARQEKEADKRLEHIKQLISENNFNTAKLKIDSIHILYSRLVAKRKIAATYKDTIIRRESGKILLYCDSVLPIRQHEFDSIKRDFRFEKNEKYQDFGNYVHKTQITAYNIERNYMKCYVNENSDLYLISYLTGNKFEHFSIQVLADNLYAETDTANFSKGIFHSFYADNQYYESLTFTNDEAEKIVNFISQNKNKRIKVKLSGRINASYYLHEQDKKAIAETYDLWVAMKDVNMLQKEAQKATIKIGNIKLRNEN